jgi:hypothetical protein
VLRHTASSPASLHPPHPFQTEYNQPTRMSSTTTEATTSTVAIKKDKKLKPARKQVKPGEVEKKEAPQTGKEYSSVLPLISPTQILVLTMLQTYGTTNGPVGIARILTPSALQMTPLI